VFAVWAGRHEVLTPELHARLRVALREGSELAFDMIRHAAMETGWSEVDLSHYLKDVIIHNLTPDSLKGLLEFARRAATLDLLPKSAVDKVLDVMRGQARF
jgi:predicted solute-binding protein